MPEPGGVSPSMASPSNEQATDLLKALESLTGQRAPFRDKAPDRLRELFGPSSGIGHSQLNELLLLYGYDRVSRRFFDYLSGGEASVPTMEQFWEGIVGFQKLALLAYGNVKYAFKTFSRHESTLEDWLDVTAAIDPRSFQDRNEPILPLEPIPARDTYYLGYAVARAFKEKLEEDPSDEEALKGELRRREIEAIGVRNHHAYLVSDHLDVYVATSMRERHEYVQVHDLASSIFGSESLRDLKLRWFDPTQAVCPDRIDKGLAEALMLKRAKCTLYLVQESDTLGKDSELASTLAQGKPVIAFIPRADESYCEAVLTSLAGIYPGLSKRQLVLQHLRLVSPGAAWESKQVREWIDESSGDDSDEVVVKSLHTAMAAHYDRRAGLLKDDHPLGIQVNLASGVANGVLVARSVEECATLIRQIMTNTLEFDLDRRIQNEREYLLLREHLTGSIFRVVTGDEMLTNTFWNFYLEPKE